ncbi:general stress protein [Sporosarcina sp.]|uniref:general stress protein n=1 Tax=Sporosarcina sp. TaxID=49982 RepID=UPI002605BCA7|nr:general stress protein [Sporosarcina sp.]
MATKRYMGMYFDETELVRRMDELKREGWPEDHIYVVVKDEDQLTMVRSRTDAEIKSATDSWWDRFMGFISGEDHVHRMVDGLDFGPAETEQYYREIDQGGMLLYVDQGQVSQRFMKNTDYYRVNRNGTDVNLGANGLSVTDQELNGGDPAFRLNETLPNQSIRSDNEYGRVGGEAVMERPVDQIVYSGELDNLPETELEQERGLSENEMLFEREQRLAEDEVKMHQRRMEEMEAERVREETLKQRLDEDRI